MKHLSFIIALMLSLASCNQPTSPTEPAAPAAEAEPAAPSKETAPPDSATMMKAWMEYATPGDMHAMVAKFDGEWNADITMWQDPSAPPAKSTGTAINRMIMGGRYQESLHTGTFAGMPFEGRSLLAFDNEKKKFINTWIDNMGTGIMVMEGAWDDASRTINFSGSQVDPVSGENMDVRETFQIVDDNTQLMQMFMRSKGGEEVKMMEIKFTRKAAF